MVGGDRGRDVRQVGIVDRDSRTAAYTGDKCVPWAGSVSGAGYVCLGNILASEDVVKAMAKEFAASETEYLQERLLRALEAGQQAGGDRRGRQSAGIIVVAQEEYPLVDLRVDDHADPIPELRRVFGVYQKEEAPYTKFMPTREDYTPEWTSVLKMREEVEESLADPVTKES